ncbi:MAG: FG-GAP-like repeat-containing protein [Candidatus Cloacimonetes bacterium]|nr:FG-GAP-like repeat-containing protein [Candidatus Cloacimonadota bacterium]
MKKLILYISAILMIVLLGPLSAQNNHLDVMTYMSGEFGGCEFGESIASLDFNGDGYMDLVVSSGAWNPNLVFADQNRWGKLYFYWGGPNFDNIPDFVIPGAYNWQMGPSAGVFNAGDMNGDGIDDLILLQTSPNNEDIVAVYFGGLNPQLTPSILLTYPNPEVTWVKIAPVGDLDGDSIDDIAIMKREYPLTTKVTLWRDFQSQPLYLFQSNNTMIPFLSGIGDVNNDGYDDTLLHIGIYPTGETHSRLVLHYGGPNFPETDSLTICEDSNSIIKSWACPLGDVNGDGYADFSAGSQVYDYSQHIWLGGEVITENWSLDLSGDNNGFPHQISERGSGYPMVHGDLNGDGYQDVIGFDHEAGYYSGYLYIWMGSSAMNGSLDFVSLGITDYDCMNYGWSKATGDFNADGYCDIAVGAPWFGPQSNHNSTGRVYIMAGNADLHDRPVANDDPLIPAVELNRWQIEVYPNPASSPETQFNLLFKGSGFKDAGDYKLEIFNLKGQKLLSKNIPSDNMKEGLMTFESKSWPKGILLLSISQDGKQLTTKKVTTY